MMSRGLEVVMAALGAEGAAVIRVAAGEACDVLYRAGDGGAAASNTATLLRKADIGAPSIARDADGRAMAASVCQHSASGTLGLVLWRRRGARDWSAEDLPLVDASAGVVRLLLDRETGRAVLSRAMRTDPVTALLNRRSFIAEASRHIGRLARDGSPGTLILAEIDNLRSSSAALGSEAGDRVLRRAAVLLRNTVRPTDLVGRIGDDELAVWLSGADHLTAAERAEALCLAAPGRIAGSDGTDSPEIRFSIGIATRRWGETYEGVARRANQAVRKVQAAGGGYWHVSLDRRT